MPRGGPNQKAVAAKEKKAIAQSIKDAESARKAEAAATTEWATGSNARGAARAESAAQKADEAARKRREKAALLAAEEEANTGTGKAKPKLGAASKKKGGGKGKKKNDLSLLEDALVGDAEKKAKEKKKAERIRREREAAAAAERERKAKDERAKRDPLLANTDAMLGMEEGDKYNAPLVAGRAANVASMATLQASGLDSALSAMSVGGDGDDDRHPEKRRKAAYKAYEEKMLLEVKAQYPGLKRQQYLNKIFEMWKKSPENPMNQQP
mmetsp:Transcript_5835/g.12829  ORF Transcript_5835/g.12829 Transcript_5835/m.12829 type:complete len:268 (+) Transcript_5835:191-994(+)|eukprot:CAMPEP_0172528388 /NCGR_PEP_ID=MMETSP1067-20121228/2798_1 /TAXON_ID=265564 ORGANISM="Thalassiosira punctigera, Strain Tpunct2005C2" /NCGR_SAMPLE_ID=MMETSP1067 /ASSEMBLY_ACC=CAM_ASM_000444 /LENGTH=267 /DNA_ID=CAMNT_0013312285 /DNA_START=93 /DNA_END=896 /DNA_ORIENTATION=-